MALPRPQCDGLRQRASTETDASDEAVYGVCAMEA